MKVLFVCRSNAERSQVAQLLFNKTSKKNNANSAGLALVDFEKGLAPGRIMTELMLSQGYNDFTKQHRKQLTEEMANGSDKVIVIMTRGQIRALLPQFVKKSDKVVYWDRVKDPKNDKDRITARNKIKKLVNALVKNLDKKIKVYLFLQNINIYIYK